MLQTMSNQRAPEAVDSTSVETLFTTCEAPLLRYAYRLTRNQGVSQEIVQEAFMKLHIQFDDVRQPRPWLYRTVHNQALNRLRSDKKIVPMAGEGQEEIPIDPVDGELHPDEYLARMEAIQHTRVCVESLEGRDRELIRLKFEENLSYKQISKKTGLSVGNVGYVLHHALKKLAAELEQSGVTL
jgi:RNA polymerase sigma factor (sigma-70 family)